MWNTTRYLTDLLDWVTGLFPDRIAVKDRREECSYRELSATARQIACSLCALGVRHGERVVLFTRKDVFSMQAFFGIILSGGIPVLLDEEEGYSVNKDKLQCVRPGYVVLNKISAVEARTWGDFCVIGRTQLMAAGIAPAAAAEQEIELSDICYMMTTSGTTGLPKVVQVSHKNILHYIAGCYQAIGSPEYINAGHVTNLSTDLGFTNIAVALASGGTLYLFDAIEAKDPETFKTVVKENKINFLKTTPSHIDALLPFCTAEEKLSIVYLILGGEKLPWSLANRLRELNICRNLFNHYGPSETTVGALMYPVGACGSLSGSVPIGKPIGEGKAYLADLKDGAGELLIEGPGVSGSYFSNDSETEARFFFNKESGLQGYRTGDICKRLEDGNFVFLNRNDRQIKVKGYRVELDEIEETMSAHEQVDFVRINTYEQDQKTIVEAYVKPRQNATLNRKVLGAWLKERLAAYKIPERIYINPDCPYNANGKIDFKTLRSEADQGQAANEGESVDWSDWESSARYCWRDALGEIYEGQHFFEGGGDSLAAIKVVGKLQMYGFDVSMFDLNDHPVLEMFLKLHRNKKQAGGRSFEDVVTPWLTRSQFSFFRTGNLTPDKYTQTVLLSIEGEADIILMSRAIRETIRTHHELNQKFIPVADDVYTEGSSHPAPVVKIYHLDPEQTTVAQMLHITGDIVDGISLERGITFQAAVIKSDPKQQFLFLACHHIIIDAISWNIILDEILTRYENIKMRLDGEIVRERIRSDFYNKLPGNMLPVMAIPAGIAHTISPLPLPVLPGKPEVGVVAIPFSEQQSVAIKNMGWRKLKDERINDILLSCFLSALFDSYSMDILSVDIEFHGRPQIGNTVDLSRSVSWWSTTFPVNFERGMASAEDIADYLNPVADYANAINAYPEIYSRSAYLKSDVRFNYLGEFPAAFRNSFFSLVPSAIASAPTRSDIYGREYKLFFTARFIGDQLIVDLQYNKGIIAREHLNRIATGFAKRLLNLAGDGPGQGGAPLYPCNIGSVGKPLYRISSSSYRRTGGKLFITGATGFLGVHLLRELLLEGESIVCLVRAEDADEASVRLKRILDYYFPGEHLHQYPGLDIVAGDLQQPFFGLNKAVYSDLSQSVETIVHSAADVNLTRSYEKLQSANVFGTEQILDFAMRGKPKTLHYASTLAVSGVASGMPLRFSEAEFDLGQTFLSEYERSKFDAENLVRTRMKQGLHAKIYRFGHIAAHSVTGRFQKNSADNRIIQLLKGILYLKKVPQVYNEKISFSHVDIVSKMMAAVITGKVDTSLECLHLENTAYYSIRDILSRLEQLGYMSEIVSEERFKEEVVSFDGSAEAMESIHAYGIWINRYVSQQRNVHYDSTVSNDLFGRYSLVFPVLTNDWFDRLIGDALPEVTQGLSNKFNFVGLDK